MAWDGSAPMNDGGRHSARLCRVRQEQEPSVLWPRRRIEDTTPAVQPRLRLRLIQGEPCGSVLIQRAQQRQVHGVGQGAGRWLQYGALQRGNADQWAAQAGTEAGEEHPALEKVRTYRATEGHGRAPPHPRGLALAADGAKERVV